MAKVNMTKKRMEALLRGLVKKRTLSCMEGSDAQKDFDDLEKMGMVRKKKNKIKSNDTDNWFDYKCTTKAEKTFAKINSQRKEK